jgi:putative inorganic carbon (HCO3(-)) transporter
MHPHSQPDTGSKRSLADELLEIGWLLVAILVPLAANMWARQPFEPTKAAILHTLVWAMAGIWLVDSLRGYRSIHSQLEGNPLLWPALGVAVTQMVATILAVDWRLALWGSYERSQGAITLLSYLLLFLVVTARLRTLPRARRLLAAMVLTSLPLIGLGLGQVLGWDPFGLISDARSPAYATLGRSNFLGAYLAMLLPLTLALTLNAYDRWKRLTGLGLTAIQAVVIALTLARGAWLSAGTALAVFFLLWLWPLLARGWRIAMSAGLAAGLGSVLAGALLLGGEGGSTAARLTIWRASLDLIAQRPLFGFGPDNLGPIFARVYPPQLVYYQGRGVAVDRAHNLLLDWTLTAGMMGTLAGLLLLAVFFLVGWRTAQQAAGSETRRLLVACLAAVTGNVVGNLVSFDLTATSAATWLLMAVVASAGAWKWAGGKTAAGDNIPAEVGKKQPLSRWVAALGLLGVAVLGVGIVQASVRAVAADILAQVADERSAVGDLAGATSTREQAVALWPDETAHRLALSWTCLQQAQTGSGSPEPWLQRSEAELLAARDLRPGDHEIWAALGELYGLWGNRWDSGKLPLAHKAYRHATDLAPHQATLYTDWGMVDLGSGKLAQAAAKFRRAVDLDATDGYAWTHLGDVEWALGRTDEALAAYTQATHWAPGLSYAHLGMARCYGDLGREKAARLALQQALQLDPTNPAALALRQRLGMEQ